MHIQESNELLRRAAGQVSHDGTLWVITRNGSGVKAAYWPWYLAEHIQKSYRFYLKNIMIHYDLSPTAGLSPLVHAYNTVLFLVKSKDYFFDKGPIREPHIFKGIEWGGRQKGSSGYHKTRESVRYPPGGRDPGNVFYQTKRDTGGQILSVFEYSKAELLKKLMLVSTKKGWTVATNIGDREFGDSITNEGRIPLMLRWAA